MQAKKSGGDNVMREPGNITESFLKKNASGWSLPLGEKNAMEKYASTLDMLYSYYANANEDLYSLLDSLGPGVGWSGKFPKARRRGIRSE